VAEDLARVPDSEARARPPQERSPRQRLRAYQRQFQIAYLALAVVLGAAIALLVLLLARPGDEKQTWSAWQPTLKGTDRAREIADFVARQYRLPSKRQLVGVVTGEPELQDVPVTNVLVARGQRREDVSVYPIESTNSLMYILCGLGESCSISEGRPTRDRHRLLRREALELALYTFRYMDDVKSVITFLPPRPNANFESVLFFRKAELRRELDEPLEATLPTGRRLSPGDLGPSEMLVVDRLTLPHLFRFQYQQGPDGGALLILQPFAA